MRSIRRGEAPDAGCGLRDARRGTCLHLVIGIAATMGSFSSTARAQADSARSTMTPALACWRGKPLPACRSFWLTEVSAEYAYASTSTRYRFAQGSYVTGYSQQDVSSRLLWTVGPMFNTAPARALGGTVSAGFVSEGARYAIEARRRWWGDSLDNHPTFDLSAGMVRLALPPGTNGVHRDAYGVTVGSYIVGADLIQVNARADLVLANNQLHSGGTAGVGLGSYAAVGATALAAALVGWVAYELAHSHWD